MYQRQRLHAEPGARLHHRRLRRPAPGARLEPGLRGRLALRRSATSSWPARSTARCSSCAPAAPTRRSSAPSSSTPRTRRLLLDYESALTRIDSRTGSLYDTSRPLRLDRRAHPATWTARTSSTSAGSATRSASSSARRPPPDDALAYLDRLDPDREPGRLTFIIRMGAGKVRDKLPGAGGEGARRAATRSAWICDPMHGNTFEAPSRPQDPPLRRRAGRGQGLLRGAPRRSARTPAASTSSSPATTSPSASAAATRSRRRPAPALRDACDPRLNRSQSLDLAFLVAEMLRARR